MNQPTDTTKIQTPDGTKLTVQAWPGYTTVTIVTAEGYVYTYTTANGGLKQL